MSGFQKPHAQKAALKIALYGPAGAGKTFSALLLAEGLARHTGKRIAFCDTEYGTSFYGQEVPQRKAHPQAFDFDVLYSKSITEVLESVRGLDPREHGVLIIDSISHIWDSCRNAYAGRTTRTGSIPLHAWGAIKKPYKELVHLLLSSPIHVIICGRQGIDYGEDEASGELKSLGYRMRAEGETPYEPDVLIRLESHKAKKHEMAIPVAHVEKDRTGVLAGQAIPWPKFENVAQPLLGLLGSTQVAPPTDEEVGLQDAEALAQQEAEQARRSSEVAAEYTGLFGQADSVVELQRVGERLTPAVKKELVGNDLARIRRAYAARLAQLKAGDEGQRRHEANGKAPAGR